jgi:hypothetical protein
MFFTCFVSDSFFLRNLVEASSGARAQSVLMTGL